MCKAGVTRDNVIPLYGRGTDRRRGPAKAGEGAGSGAAAGEGGGAEGDAADDVPQRPAGRRPPPPPEHHGAAGAAPGGPQVAFTAGFGFFPSLFGLQFQSFQPPHTHGADATPEEIQQARVSRALVMLGMFVVLCLMLF